MWGEPKILTPLIEIVGHFNSLAPCGANRFTEKTDGPIATFQLTRPVWGEPTISRTASRIAFISTHSPRVGRTKIALRSSFIDIDFNSLAPCGANPTALTLFTLTEQFQLTRPVWGEPLAELTYILRTEISTHSPRVGRTPV